MRPTRVRWLAQAKHEVANRHSHLASFTWPTIFWKPSVRFVPIIYIRQSLSVLSGPPLHKQDPTVAVRWPTQFIRPRMTTLECGGGGDGSREFDDPSGPSIVQHIFYFGPLMPIQIATHLWPLCTRHNILFPTFFITVCIVCPTNTVVMYEGVQPVYIYLYFYPMFNFDLWSRARQFVFEQYF